MANTFKTVTFAAEPASSGTPYVMYTVAGSTKLCPKMLIRLLFKETR